MGIDVATVQAQYEDAADREPMHGQAGQIRRNPSTDQRKVRRQMTKKKAEVADTATIAELLGKAASAQTMEQKQAIMAQVEQLRTERDLVMSAEASLDLSVKEAVEIIPHGTHELSTESTDWLTSTAAYVKGDANEAERALVAEATMWFERVPDYVKEVPEEFQTQASNKAHYIASQYGDAAPAAAAAFVAEASRLHKMAVKGGLQVTAATVDAWDLDSDKPVIRPTEIPSLDREPGGPLSPSNQSKNLPNGDGTAPAAAPVKPEIGVPNLLPKPHFDRLHLPYFEHEMQKAMTGEDAAGVRGMGEQYAHHVLRGGSLQHSASLRHDEDDETTSLGAVLAGFALLEGAEAGEGAAAGGGEAGNPLKGMGGAPGGGGGIGGAVDGLEKGLDSSSDGVRAAGEQEADHELGRTSSSQVPQVGSQGAGGTSGLPLDTFPNFAGQPYSPNVDSNRAPALQEISNFTGWDGTSVVSPNRGEAQMANGGQDAETRDASVSDQLAGQFPVGSHTASKESAMTEHAQCPTCGGHGKVAVRKQAYSGLPQIDQIVNADESDGKTEYPTEVAFPLTGWGQSPQQGQQNVQKAIDDTEKLISERNSRSPMMTTGQVHQANGRDNSGWLGDDGAKGTDYPGYSEPTGYDGSSNLGMPDPVYGYGGDNSNQPLKPYGAMEANDVTNNPPQPYDPGAPHNNDQAYRSVAPGMSTQGSQDPFIAAAQDEIRRQQAVIAARNAQYRRQQGR